MRSPVPMLAGAALLFAGCTYPAFNDPAWIGPFFHPANVMGEPSLGGIRRVIVLPVARGQFANEELGAALDQVVQDALRRENRFEVVVLPRQECQRWFHAPELSSAGALPRDFFAVLRREYAAEAVLFIDLTALAPYPPLAVGMRAKLAALEDRRLIWSFDNLFSAAEPPVANAARRQALERFQGGLPADLSPAILQSPRQFTGYVAATMFATLPPVIPPPARPAGEATRR